MLTQTGSSFPVCLTGINSVYSLTFFCSFSPSFTVSVLFIHFIYLLDWICLCLFLYLILIYDTSFSVSIFSLSAHTLNSAIHLSFYFPDVSGSCGESNQPLPAENWIVSVDFKTYAKSYLSNETRSNTEALKIQERKGLNWIWRRWMSWKQS